MDQHGSGASPEFDRPQGFPADDQSASMPWQGFDQPLPPRRRKGHAIIAWLVILLAFSILFARQFMPEEALPHTPTQQSQPRTSQSAFDLKMLELQARYLVGVSRFAPGNAGLLDAIEQFTKNASVDQRLRVVVLAAELAGADAAWEELQELEALLEHNMEREPEEQVQVAAHEEELVEILRKLYAPRVAEGEPEPASWEPYVEDLTQHERDLLLQHLDWFGKLALLPAATSDQTARDELLDAAVPVMLMFVGGVMLACLVAFAGFVGLILMLVFLVRGSVRSNLPPSVAHHGIYAETFAVWLVGFFGLQILAGSFPGLDTSGLMLLSFVAFMGSLLALGWPVLRGIPWAQVRRDIGWTMDRGPMEIVVAPAGYAMTLPIVAVGLLMTLALMFIDQMISPPLDPLEPTIPPSHPVVEILMQPGIGLKLVVLLVAAVAAPVVEETFFRGVLYRHLRDGMRGLGNYLGIVLGALINAFIFAGIHPQGWVAIPVLMSLAIGFTLMREWRGSVVPSIIAHGINNFCVMTFLIILLSL